MIVDVKKGTINGKYMVYDILYDKCGYPHFLIYIPNEDKNKKGRWLEISAKYCKPYY